MRYLCILVAATVVYCAVWGMTAYWGSERVAGFVRLELWDSPQSIWKYDSRGIRKYREHPYYFCSTRACAPFLVYADYGINTKADSEFSRNELFLWTPLGVGRLFKIREWTQSVERNIQWFDTTFRVYTDGKKGGHIKVKGKQATYVIYPEYSEHLFTAFVTDNGHVWAGRERDCYIETDSGIAGLDVRVQGVLWADSEVSSVPMDKMKTVWVVQSLEHEINSRGVIGMLKYYSGDNMISFEFFKEYNDCNVSALECFELSHVAAPVEVAGNVVRLEVAGNLHNNGTLWIDMNTRKLLRAAIKGKQVYPK